MVPSLPLRLGSCSVLTLTLKMLYASRGRRGHPRRSWSFSPHPSSLCASHHAPIAGQEITPSLAPQAFGCAHKYARDGLKPTPNYPPPGNKAKKNPPANQRLTEGLRFPSGLRRQLLCPLSYRRPVQFTVHSSLKEPNTNTVDECGLPFVWIRER